MCCCQEQSNASIAFTVEACPQLLQIAWAEATQCLESGDEQNNNEGVDYKRYFEEAIDSYLNGKFHDSKRLATAASLSLPEERNEGVHCHALISVMLAEVNRADGHFQDALKWCDKSLQQSSVLSSQLQVALLSLRGQIIFEQGDYQQGQKAVNAAQLLAKTQFGIGHPLTLEISLLDAHQSVLSGLVNLGVEKCDGLQAAVKKLDPSRYSQLLLARFHVVMGFADFEKLNFADSQRNSSTATMLYRTLPTCYRSEQVFALQLLAQNAICRRDYESARGFLQEAEELTELEGPSTAHDLAICFYLYAILDSQAGKPEIARNSIARALGLMTSYSGETHPDYAMPLALTAHYIEPEEREKAYKYLDWCISLLWEKSGLRCADNCARVASMLEADAQFEKAAEFSETAYHLTSAGLGPRHSRTIRAARQWAQNVASAGNSGQALEILSVQIKNAPFGVSDEIGPDEIECLELIHDRAMLQRSVGDIDGAANSWKIIMKVCESDDLDVHVNELKHRAFDGIQSLRKPSR